MTEYYEYDPALNPFRFQNKDEFMHYGILRKSGRYPWGSGADEYQRSMDFFSYVNGLRDKGIPDTDIAKAIGLAAPDDKGFSVQDLRSTRTIAKEQQVLEETNRAVTLRDKGVSIQEISNQMGIPAPTVRLRLKNSENIKESALRSTANAIRKEVDQYEIVDIGKGVEHHLGVADTRKKAAIAVLRDEGYQTYTLQTKQVGGRNFTNQKVIVKPGVTFGEANKMKDKIHTMGTWSEDEGMTFFGIHPPISINPNRVKVNFDEDGGSNSDGLILVRRGAKDLDMGKNVYAQVRILIGDKHYMKGMAVVTDDLPDGVDIVFNTNKKREVGKLGALKPITDDEQNPFGSIVKRQIVKTDPKTGQEKVTSALNLLREEGDWDVWRKSIPSQLLAKQPHSLIKSQLQVTRDEKINRLAEINKITNPVVRKKALEDFADQTDSDAVDLRAAQMPRQATRVLIPMPKMNKNEIYAPQFETGESVVLVRFPHGGRFEIPEVVVNNNNRTAKKLLGNAVDAIGIHPSVAERLSGADFDGDAVLVIPNRAGKIKGSKSMGSQAKVFDDGLKNFDPKRKYGNFVQTGTDSKGRPTGNFKLMTNTGMEMGMITNLVTDMSIQGAKPEHIVRAVKHSMVVIDAEKHKLNYRQSEIDNNIAQLRHLYQTTVLPDGTTKVGGATTLLSKATAGDRTVLDRKLRSAPHGGPIDKETGALVYEPTGKMKNKYDRATGKYLDGKDGRPLVLVPVTKEVKKLALTNDAYDLVKDKADPVERLYADHANEMKALANGARLQADRTVVHRRNPLAKKVYAPEIEKLEADLKLALKQSPLDRRADIIAGATYKAKLLDDPSLRLDSEKRKKVERQAKSAARARLGLKKPVIEVTDRQWDAIQADGVSASKLREILRFTDPRRIEELAMPRTNSVMTKAISSRAKAMLAAGANNADVARALGIPLSTLRGAALRGEL